MTHPSIIQVAIPSPLRRIFDYLAPVGLAALPQPGCRVRVPFGRKQLVGVVLGVVAESALPLHKLKSISEVLDPSPLFSEKLFSLLSFAAAYYQYPIGEVLHQAIPVALRQGAPAVLALQTGFELTELGWQVEQAVFKRAPKQWQTLQRFREISELNAEHLVKTQHELTSLGITRPNLKILIDKHLVKEVKISKIKGLNPLVQAGPMLNAEQLKAVESIKAAQNSFSCFLLDGITGSGKTEVYLSSLESLLCDGGQALVLVPEIGLTPQTINRFRERLNCPIGLFHSGLTDKQRLESWLKVKTGDISVLIGTRSAIFAPFNNLKMIVVDESHDASFKQWDGFKYNARDLAIRRAQLNNIPIVLGSATPSLTSLHNAALGRFTLLPLTVRATGAKLPQFHLIDMRQQKLVQGLAPAVLQAIGKHVEQGNQVLVFLNRRGFAPIMLCHECGWVAECQRCEAPFTKHLTQNNLQCHHCGKHKPIPVQCAECGGGELLDVGLGTQRVEQCLQQKFKKTNITRIDRDTTRKKGDLEHHLQQAHSGQAQILIGTQMLAKGHHFPNVTLVVMLDADGGLYSADFFATEKMAQLLLQVAGRAGREEKPGEVLIQTHHPEHPLLQILIKQGYSAFAKTALAERQATQLPPFVHLALFRVEAVTNAVCETFLIEVQKLLGECDVTRSLQVYSPSIAPVEKRVGRFRWQLLVSSTKRKALQQLLGESLLSIERLSSSRKVRWSIDVDPVDML
jgi:primosomal protein N' (replication factor Y)